jgi:uncharacterized protein (DUF1330 family)
MKAYWVVAYRRIVDQEAWAAYAKLARPAVQKAGGTFIVGGMPAATWEKGEKERVVIVEFESLQKALDAHETPEYQAALKALGHGAERDMRVVEGLT